MTELPCWPVSAKDVKELGHVRKIVFGVKSLEMSISYFKCEDPCQRSRGSSILSYISLVSELTNGKIPHVVNKDTTLLGSFP